MHLNRVTNDDHQNHQKFLKISSEGPSEFCTIDCETLEVGASRPFPFKVRGRVRVKSSCNGLVCLFLKNDDIVWDLLLWNPLTNDYKILAKTDINKKLLYLWGTVFELYYNSCEADSKLIATPFTGGEFWSGPMVQGGCIHLYVKSQYSCKSPIELWMMKRDGEWMKVSTYKDKLYDKNAYLEPLHLMRDGTWLMRSESTHDLYKVKKNKGETCENTLKGIEAPRHIQTFLSPNQYMN
ncbi:hypothetical protein Tco_0599494 [Tanacetum coccineum]